MKIKIAGLLIAAHDTSHNMPATVSVVVNKIHIIRLIFHFIKGKETKQE